jgi:hypothetical protein
MILSRRAFLTTGGAALAVLSGPTAALATIRSIDHLSIAFKELEPAILAYRDLGFTVVPGGENASFGTHNALVAFADGSYLELLAFTRPNEQHRWWSAAQSGGLIDFCMATDDLAADIQAFRDAGVKMGDPGASGRERPDGYRLSWVIASAPKPFMFQAPFLIQDHTPREERVPKQTSHPNRVIGVASITVATDDVARVRGWWSAVLRQPGAEVQRGDIDATGVRFIVGPHTLDFVEPRGAASPINAWLKARGPSPYAMDLKTSGGKTGPLDEAKTGTRITIV